MHLIDGAIGMGRARETRRDERGMFFRVDDLISVWGSGRDAHGSRSRRNIFTGCLVFMSRVGAVNGATEVSRHHVSAERQWDTGATAADLDSQSISSRSHSSAVSNPTLAFSFFMHWKLCQWAWMRILVGATRVFIVRNQTSRGFKI